METGRNKKHNLLHVVGTLGMGGAEMMLVQYTKALGNEQYKHFVYCFGSDGVTRSLLEDLGVLVAFGPKVASIKNPFKFTLSLFSLFKSLYFYIKENSIKTIHSHNAQSDKVSVVIGILSRVPAFPTIHSTQSILDKRNKFDPRVYINKIVDQVIYRSADRVIAVSEEVKESVCRRYGLRRFKVVVVKNGIVSDQIIINYTIKKEKTLNKQQGLNVLAVGRLASEKRYDVLIKAAAEILERGHKNIFVQIIGDGEEYATLSALVRELGLDSSVEMLGEKTGVVTLMRDADLLVITSSYEGLSIAMVEAFSCGLPVIASDAPGLSDHISQNKNGMLFPVGDHIALAECILNVAGNRKLRASLSRGARQSYLDHYDMRKNIQPLSLLLDNYRVN